MKDTVLLLMFLYCFLGDVASGRQRNLDHGKCTGLKSRNGCHGPAVSLPSVILGNLPSTFGLHLFSTDMRIYVVPSHGKHSSMQAASR